MTIKNIRYNKTSNIGKKGQMKMMETIGVLLVFFILVGVVLMFFAGTQRASANDARSTLAGSKSVETAQAADYLLEMQCTEENIPVDNCIEIEKAQLLGNMTANDAQLNYEHYYSVFGYATISISQIYPYSAGNIIVYNNTLAKSHGNSSFTFPVLLYSSKKGVSPKRYNFGVLNVMSYY